MGVGTIMGERGLALGLVRSFGLVLLARTGERVCGAGGMLSAGTAGVLAASSWSVDGGGATESVIDELLASSAFCSSVFVVCVSSSFVASCKLAGPRGVMPLLLSCVSCMLVIDSRSPAEPSRSRSLSCSDAVARKFTGVPSDGPVLVRISLVRKLLECSRKSTTFSCKDWGVLLGVSGRSSSRGVLSSDKSRPGLIGKMSENW